MEKFRVGVLGDLGYNKHLLLIGDLDWRGIVCFRLKYISGFTLIEMMVVLIVIGVLIAIAYPNIINMLSKMEAKKVESVLFSALTTARNESHITKQNIIVCPANELNVCNKQAIEKVIVFYDSNDDATLDKNELINEYGLNLKYGRLDMRVSLSRDYIKYFGVNAAPRGHFGHIKYCSSNIDLSYKVILTHLGLMRKEKEAC